jgi:hypothetical protein
LSVEDRALKLIYLALTSRFTDKPVSAATKAQSSTGKNSNVDAALKLFPPSAYYQLSSLSEKALAYMKEPLKHRTLVVAEAPGLASSGSSATMMRTLLSEGCISTVAELEAKTLYVEGPTNLIVTTTKFQLEGELETRVLSVRLDDSDEQTRAIMRVQAAQAMPGAPKPPDLHP